MLARNPEKILESLIENKGKESKLRRKLITNTNRNWFLALMLNSFAKLDEGKPLTDLDKIFVETFRANGFKDTDLKQQGRLYRKLPAQLRSDIFPGKFANLTSETKYTLEDLKQESPKIVKSVLSMKNVTNVDVHAVHAGTAHRTEFPMVPKDVQRTHAGALFLAVDTETPPSVGTYTITATRFRCNDETGTDFLGSDEPYWIFGSLGSGTAVTTRSQVFEDVDTGETRNFAAGEGCIWGQNCAPQVLPEGEVSSLISLFEHDDGDPDKIKAGVAAAFAAAAGILAATGVAAWIAAVVAGVGAAIQWLLGFLDDDHIADQTFVFTSQVIEKQLKQPGASMDITRRFSDGDGDYTLTINVCRTS
jgi:hypothetical protein